VLTGSSVAAESTAVTHPTNESESNERHCAWLRHRSWLDICSEKEIARPTERVNGREWLPRARCVTTCERFAACIRRLISDLPEPPIRDAGNRQREDFSLEDGEACSEVDMVEVILRVSCQQCCWNHPNGTSKSAPVSRPAIPTVND